MKKRLIGAALVAVVIMAVFASCSDEPQDVNVVNDYINIVNDYFTRSNAVSSVSAAQTTDNNYVIVSWDAIEGGVSYNVYIQQQGKNTINANGYGQNNYTYSVVDGSSSVNTDIDKWSVNITVRSYYGYINLPAGNYRFGVTAQDITHNTQSDITWSGYITVQ